MREEVQDRFGNKIYMTDERWQHIISSHPQLKERRAEVLNTIRFGKRWQDARLPEKFYYLKPFPFPGAYNAIKVVVRFSWKNNQPNNFVLTAYPK